MAGYGDHWVLVIERDPVLREGILVPGLRRAGFSVVAADEAAAARRCMRARRICVFVLDAGLHEGDEPLARRLRALTDAGIVALVDSEASQRDRVRMLEHGADVCLPKPVDIDVLVPTVHNLLRRLRNTTVSAAGWNDASPWRIEARGWSLALPGGNSLHLTHAERLLLEVLSASPGRAVPHEVVLSRLAEAMPDADTYRLTKLVGRLRRRIAERTSERLPLEVVRGVGYVLQADLAPPGMAQRHRAHRPVHSTAAD